MSVALFTFEPGDGVVYRVLFGRLPSSTPLIPFYTVIGIAEGLTDPGTWFPFSTEVSDEHTFDRHMLVPMMHVHVYFTAWRVWLALTGQPDDAEAAARLPAWRDDWRQQLPSAALG